MKYDELYDDFKNLFPEHAEFFKAKEEETGADKEDGISAMTLIGMPNLRD